MLVNDDLCVVTPGKDEGGSKPGLNEALALLCSLHINGAMNNHEVAVRVTTEQAKDRPMMVVLPT